MPLKLGDLIADAAPKTKDSLSDAAAGLAALGLLTDEQAGQLADVTDLDYAVLVEVRDRVVAWAQAVDVENPSGEDLEGLVAAGKVVKAIAGEVDRRRTDESKRGEAATKLVDQVLSAGADVAAPPAGFRRPSISRLSAAQPGRTKPQRNAGGGLLVASASSALLASGGEVHTPDALAAGLARQVDTQTRQRHMWPDSAESIVLASADVKWPESRVLGLDENANESKLEAVTSPQALTASGGVCGPVGADYSILGGPIDDRPVRGAMAQFAASRGGVRFILPHTVAQVTADGPASVWTASNDANPTNPTVKPHAVFSCQAVQETLVDAVTSIVTLGNFQARYFPEQVGQYLKSASSVHARLGEATLLGALSAGSTSVTADNYELGAARDFLAIIDRAVEAQRYRNRLGLLAPLRLVAPSHLRSMVRADLARQAPGDSGGGQAERLAVADSEIAAFLAVRGVNVTWYLDSPTGAGILQGFGVQGAGQLLPWPLQTTVYLYPEGSWTFLDGGELNLGMVRDSILNRTNDMQFFMESFEKAVFRGHESLQLNLKLAPTGASAGTVPTFTGGAETIGS